MEPTATAEESGRDPVNVLAIDKTAVLEHVRDRWDRLGGTPGVNLTLLVPEMWIENFRPHYFRTNRKYRFREIIGKTWGTGRELRAIYRSGVREAFLESKPDVILMFEESFSLFALQLLRAKNRYAPEARLVFYSNNVTSYRMPGYRLAPLYRAIADYVTPRCAAGLCVNDVAARVLAEAGYDTEIRTLFYGIDENRFAPADRALSREKLGLDPDETIVLYAGRLIELKGVQDLIEAFEKVQQRNPEQQIRLLIVGDGPYRENLEIKVAQCGLNQSVEFRDVLPIEEMPALMSACDMLVLPSRAEFNEQFGRVNAETMLCGTIVIGSTSGAIPRVLGDAGFIFPAGDVDGLASMIEYVLDHPEEVARKRVQGREFALQRYSTGATVEQLRKLIDDLMGSRTRQAN